jgi:hypothetical protein
MLAHHHTEVVFVVVQGVDVASSVALPAAVVHPGSICPLITDRRNY